MKTARPEHGYNLVEVLIAMALLGTILMSVITLFYFGRRNVYSGKQQTKINAVGTRLLEDLTNMTPDDVMANFNVNDTTSLASPCITLNGVVYNGCVARRTSSFTTTDDPSGYLARWKALLGTVTSGTATDAFQNPIVTLIIIPADYRDATKKASTCEHLRVRAVLQWQEGLRVRYTTVDASKLKRPDDNLTN